MTTEDRVSQTEAQRRRCLFYVAEYLLISIAASLFDYRTLAVGFALVAVVFAGLAGVYSLLLRDMQGLWPFGWDDEDDDEQPTQ